MKAINSSICADLGKLLDAADNNQELTDVVIAVGSKNFHLHKAILAAR